MAEDKKRQFFFSGSDTGAALTTLYNDKNEKKGVEVSIPESMLPKKHAGGRPTKLDYEGALLPLAWRYSHAGMWDPTTEDLEKELRDWLRKNCPGHDLNPDQIQRRAKRFYGEVIAKTE